MKYEAEQQYQRMLRSHEKLKAIGTDIGRGIEMGAPEARDAAQAFFADCQTFKNWLKKDPRVRPKDVEDHIGSSKALSLAIDFRHDVEHAGSNAPRRSGDQLERLIMAYTIDLPGNQPLQ